MLRIYYLRWPPDQPFYQIQCCEQARSAWEELTSAYLSSEPITLGVRQYRVRGLLKHAIPETDGRWRVSVLVEDLGLAPSAYDCD